MKYKIYFTEFFQKKVESLANSDQEIIRNFAKSLVENPFIGKPLRYPFLREKRLREKRVYFLVYEEFSLVLFVSIGGKKDQKKTIDFIANSLSEYKEYAKKISLD